MKRPEIITNEEPKRYVIIRGYGSMQERAVARGVIRRDFARSWLLAEMAERGRPGETWAIAGPGHTLTAEWLTTDANQKAPGVSGGFLGKGGAYGGTVGVGSFILRAGGGLIKALT